VVERNGDRIGFERTGANVPWRILLVGQRTAPHTSTGSVGLTGEGYVVDVATAVSTCEVRTA
jgi:hypothetical protein